MVAAVLAWATDRLLGTRTAGATATPRPRRAPFTVRGVVATLCVLVLVSASASWLVYVTVERRAVLNAGDLDQTVYPGALTSVDEALWPAPPGIAPFPNALVAQDDWPGKDRPGCAADDEESVIYTCVFGAVDGELRVALAGGSHAVNFLVPLDSVGQRRGILVDTYFKKGCPVRFIPGDDSSCEAWSRAVVAQVIADHVDAVVLTGTRPDPDNGGDRVPESYVRVWEELSEAGIPVFAIRDTPWLPFNGPECVEVFGRDGCTVLREEVLTEVSPLAQVAETMDQVYEIDFSDIFCDESVCRTVIGNVHAYIDSNHLTSTFSGTLSSPLDDRLGAAAGWW